MLFPEENWQDPYTRSPKTKEMLAKLKITIEGVTVSGDVYHAGKVEGYPFLYAGYVRVEDEWTATAWNEDGKDYDGYASYDMVLPTDITPTDITPFEMTCVDKWSHLLQSLREDEGKHGFIRDFRDVCYGFMVSALGGVERAEHVVQWIIANGEDLR